MNNCTRSFVIALSMLVFGTFSSNTYAQINTKLPRSTPEMEGVSSSGIIDFLHAVDTSGVELHSYMFIRHGKVIAEGWWAPYSPGYKHVLFSASKTFTATAIGLAVSENKLKVSDKVVSFFPYSLPDTISEYMSGMTVQNLLTMSAGQDPEPSSRGNNGDWITTFLAAEPIHQPGTIFKYNNMATFMLSAIVQQVTGETVFDYLMPRIFIPLGIRGIDWDLNPQGINLGMIGLRLRTEDLAKFGQLLLQEGEWNKKQLISKEWIKEATSFKIKSDDGGANKAVNELNDWAQGYAYQMWRGRNNTVRLDGMGGQFVVLIPDKDAIVVFTANAKNTQDELNLMHNFLIPAIKSDKALASNPDLVKQIETESAKLIIKPDSLSSKSALVAKISEKEFMLTDNEYNIQSVYFSFGGEKCTFSLKRDNKIASVNAGLNNWEMSKTLSSSLLAPPRSDFSKSIDANYSIIQPVINLGAQYIWTDENTLEITGRFVEESIFSETIVCKFSERNGKIGVTVETKVPAMYRMFMGEPVVLRGSMVDIK